MTVLTSLSRVVISAALLACPAVAGVFGTAVDIGGHASDIAYDARRAVVYVANFTANRIEVLSTSDNTLRDPIPVALQPGSLALSANQRYLVVTHVANFTPASQASYGITILDLDTNLVQTLAIAVPPLAVAFGGGNMALVVTTKDFRLLDPQNGALQTLKLADLTTGNLPVPFATYPPDIIKASTGVSGDGVSIFVLAEGAASASVLQYNIVSSEIRVVGITASPALGPRVISVSQNGDTFLAGWALFNKRYVELAQFPYPTGKFSIGGHAYDWSRNLIYAQIPGGSTQTSTPGSQDSTGGDSRVLHVVDPDNLTVRERIQLPENITGKSVFSSDMQTLYAVSDSGVMVLPVGNWSAMPRVTASQEDLIFRASGCDRQVMVREIEIISPTGGPTDFALTVTPSSPGIRLSPSSGVTNTKVRIEVDPTVFQNQKGTTELRLEIRSSRAVNLPQSVRLLINTREPDQRGTLFNVPGKLVDILADPWRDRFYVLRQDRNQMLVFDGTSMRQIASLRTGNTPTQMAITSDARYMIVGNDNSQIANVYDLDTLESSQFIEFPGGHYPRSIAVSYRSILSTVRSVSSTHSIDRIDFNARVANALPTLGIFNNDINVDTVLAASPSGSKIVGLMPNGTVFLYDASADTFVASRKDLAGLGGAYAAVNDSLFVADTNVLNRSLVAVGQLDAQKGSTSGFVEVDGLGLFATAAAASSPGILQRVDLKRFEPIRPTRIIEAPLLPPASKTAPAGQTGQTISPFTRTIAPLANRISIVVLSTSGFVVLPWQFDAAFAVPSITAVRNSADNTQAVAPGGLITISGTELSASSEVNPDLPAPGVLGGVCVTVNKTAIPLFSVSPAKVVAQLPFSVVGNASMVLRTPGGVSNEFKVTILPTAPSIFQTGTAGPDSGLATVYRTTNYELVTLSNPIHPDDEIVIFLTGMGAVSPEVEAGYPAPFDPLAFVQNAPVVSLGGVPLGVGFAGLTPGQAGVYQINAWVPFKGVPLGMEIPLTIEQGGFKTTLSVRVVK